MSRLDNWQNNLVELIEANKEKPFDFATHNCLMWAGSAIEAVTGENPVAHHAGAYANEKAAVKFLRKVDKVKTSEELLSKSLGWPKPIAFARMGDIVLVDPEQTELDLPADIELFGLVPGVCYGAVSFFVGELGLVTVTTLSLGKTLWVS